MILYFSGTGNSRYVANKIGDVLVDEVVSVNDYLKQKKRGSFSSDQPFVFVSPTYMSRMPMEVEQFIRNSRFSGNRDAYYVFTAGQSIGNAPKYCRKLCSENKLQYRGTASVAMPANYVLMYDVTPKQKAKEEAKKADADIRKIAECIKNGESLDPDPKMSGHKSFSMIAPAFHKFMISAKGFQAGPSCTGCGKCAELCPLNNIKIQNKKPVWGKECMHCMACISACPDEAINYGKKTEKRNRYYFEG